MSPLGDRSDGCAGDCEGDARLSRAVRIGLAVVLALSLTLKWGLADWAGDLAARGDEGQYLAAAASLRAGEDVRYRYPRWDALHFPPLYPRFVALFEGRVGVQRAQAVVSTATVLLLFLLGRRTVGPRAAFLAAAGFAFYPTAVAYTHYVLSETLFLFLLTAAALFLWSRDGRLARPPGLALAGALFGAAALTRETAAYLALVLVPWIAFGIARATGSARKAIGPALAFLAGFALVLAPHTSSIHREHGGFLLVSSGAGQAWYRGYNVFPPENHDYGFPVDRRSMAQQHHAATKRPPVVDPNPVRYVREETRRGLEFAREHPLTCLARFVQREVELLNPTSLLVRRLRTDTYVRPAERRPLPIPGALREALIAATVASWIALAVLAVLGLAALPATGARGHVRSFLLAVVLFLMVFGGLTFAGSRYRVPLLPFAMLAAASAVANGRATLAALRSPPRALTVGAILALLAWAFAQHIGKNWLREWP